ncbi:MAG TPA: hypothetical protein VFH61_10710 [Thermoleophilia bacterium]|nr:hypothetical protein [Thermoleophilia bacterium]
MSRRDHPRLYDTIRSLVHLLDQPPEDIGQLTYQVKSEVPIAARHVYQDLYGQLSQLDANLDLTDVTLTAVAGVPAVELPDDFRALRSLDEVNASGRKIRECTWGEWGRRDEYDCDFVLVPRSPDHDGAAVLAFTDGRHRAATLRMRYARHPPALIHGCTPSDAGATSLPLGDHELSEDNAQAGTLVYIAFDQGTPSAAGQERLISASDGPTRVATVPAWTVIPSRGAIYTSRPDLTAESEPAMILGMALYLEMKLQDNRLRVLGEAWQSYLGRLKQQLKTANRAKKPMVQNTMARYFGPNGDPMDGGGGYY